MSRCEDYPCCGHESGGCPDESGRYNCATCGKKLPAGARSAVCRPCMSRYLRRTRFDGPESDY